jgi:hypothetical protein
MSAIRAKLEAIKKKKVSAIKKEKSASDSVHQLLASLTKPDNATRLQCATTRQGSSAQTPAKAPAKDGALWISSRN